MKTGKIIRVALSEWRTRRMLSVVAPVLAALALAAAGTASAAVAGHAYAEQYRPQFHFSPPRHWMNDPNGLVYLDGEYHLFYQYNPDAEVWGPMHWGHAVSRDLVHWENLPVALFPDALGTIFSGSIVADSNNSSGLGTAGQPPLIALYTNHDEAAKVAGRIDFQNQSLAYSLDKGRTWSKYPGNPVLKNPGLRDFRDPKVSWFEPLKIWVMTLVAGDHVQFYSSQDLKSWRHESDFGREWGAHGGVWECPDLFAMTVAGTAIRKYVLLVSVNPGGPNGGSATQYFVGDFDGHRFTLDAGWQKRLGATPSKVLAPAHEAPAAWLDYGTDDYAGVTWSNLPDPARHVFLGWMSNWQYAQQVPTETWRSAMTLPRDLILVTSPRGLELRMAPAAELERLRASSAPIAARTVRGVLELTGAPDTGSGLFEVDLTLDTAASDVVTLRFSNVGGDETVFRINRKQKRYELDRARSGAVNFHPQFAAMQFAPMQELKTVTSLKVFLDSSSVEVFVDHGRTAMTAVVFPATPYTRVTLEGDSTVKINSGSVHRLNSIWQNE